MEFRILGALEVVDGSRLVDVGSAAKKSLLAILLLHPNQVLSVDRLVDDLWADSPPPAARGTLPTYIRALRRTLEPEGRGGCYQMLITRPPGYLLQLKLPDELDAARFETLVVAGRRSLDQGDFAGAGATLRKALELWRGAALADFCYQPFAEAEAMRLEEARLAAVECRVEADLGAGRRGELVGELEALVSQHPLREAFWRQLMLALYRGGRPAEALRAYQRVHHRLGELGLEPSQELRRLEAAIIRQEDWLEDTPEAPDHVSVRTPGPAQPTPDTAHNLPAPVSSFVGREFERREVRKLVERERLVTLTGAGGCGKTRLAIAAAADLAAEGSGGVWFVDLAPVGDAALVPQAAAVALGAREQPGRAIVDSVVDALRASPALLVLDNCEHLVDAAAKLADALLRSCPGLRILATSREVLGIPGETIFRVPSLSLPRERAAVDDLLDYEAIRLFFDRATAVQPQLGLGADNAAAVVCICSRLDGIPLAIELAAARTAALTPHQIVARLDDRFRLLVGGNRAALPRHRTLLATLDWSHDLLTPDEQVLLRRLSVFAGHFSLEAAEAVGSGPGIDAEEVLSLLAELVNRSLLVVEPQADEARYRMLETIRAYAGDKLVASGEEEATRERHLVWWTGIAEENSDGPRREPWLERLEANHADIQPALAWATEHRPDEAALRLATALFRFWEPRGYWAEGRAGLEAALGRSGDTPSSLRARALSLEAELALRQDDRGAARPLLGRSLAMLRTLSDPRETARSVYALGLLAAAERDLTSAGAHIEEALGIYRELDDRRLIARCLNDLGVMAYYQGDHRTAGARYQEALAIFRALNDQLLVGNCLNNLGLVSYAQGDYSCARSLIEDGLAACEPVNRQQRAGRLESLGRVAAEQGDLSVARSCFHESLALAQEFGSQELVAFCLDGLGRIAAQEGHAERAARLRGAAEALREAIGCALPEVDRPGHEQVTASLRASLGEDTFLAAWAAGKRMTSEEALAFATGEGAAAVPRAATVG